MQIRTSRGEGDQECVDANSLQGFGAQRRGRLRRVAEAACGAGTAPEVGRIDRNTVEAFNISGMRSNIARRTAPFSGATQIAVTKP